MDNYIIQLSDNREITLSSNDISLYPHIQGQIDDLAGNTIVLIYPDAEALYLVLTRAIEKYDHDLDIYIRLIGAVDYLGNDIITNNMIQNFLLWFDTPQKLAQLKPQKQRIKDLIGQLSVTTLWKFIEPYQGFQLKYISDQKLLTTIDAISPNLDYTVSFEEKSPNIYVFKQGQEIMFIKSELKPIHMAISDNGDVYIVETTAEDKTQIIKFSNLNPKGPVQVIVIQDQIRDIQLATDGSKYMIIRYPECEIFYLKYNLRDMSTHKNIIEGLSRIEYHPAFPSPKCMTVVIGEDIVGDENKYFIHSTNNNMKCVQKPVVNGKQLTYNVSVNYNSSLDQPKNIQIVFSYDEKLYMEVICVSNNEPATQFLSESKVMNTMMAINYYIIRILDINGQVLTEPFISKEIPLGLSSKYLLTVVTTSREILHNDKNINIDEDCVVVRNLTRLSENVVQIIKPPKTFIQKAGDNIKRITIKLKNVIPGPEESFLFIYMALYHYEKFHAMVNTLYTYAVKYQYIPCDNVDEFLDYKLR